MKARATLLGHPIHQILIVLPLGLFVVSVVFDVLSAWRYMPQLSIASFWNVVVGVGAGVVAALFGFIDWTKIPSRTRAKRLGILHALVNIAVVAMFAISAGLRYQIDGYVATATPLALEVVGFVLAGLGGWMGGELVDRLGIGVHEHAHADAPSSLSQRPATDHATSLHPAE